MLAAVVAANAIGSFAVWHFYLDPSLQGGEQKRLLSGHTSGNTDANSTSNGLAVSDGEYDFFAHRSSYDGGDKIEKCRRYGTGKTTIVEDKDKNVYFNQLNIDRGLLYYEKHTKIDEKNTKTEIHVCKKDGSQDKTIYSTDDNPGYSMDHFSIYDHCIYLELSSYDSSTDLMTTQFWTMDTAGANRNLACSEEGNGIVQYSIVKDKIICYYHRSVTGGFHNTITAQNFDGSDKREIYSKDTSNQYLKVLSYCLEERILFIFWKKVEMKT